MKKNSFVISAVLYGVALGALAHAQAPGAAKQPAAAPPAAAAAPAAFPLKIGVMNFTDCMQRSKEGQKGLADINTKFGPKKAEFDKRQDDITQLTDKLNKGRVTMSDDAQRALNADIQKKTTDLKRFGEDSEAEYENEEQKLATEIQQKMGPIVAEYARQNGFAIVLDVGNQSPVLWYATATNISDVVVALYDQAHPADVPAVGAKPAIPPTKPPGKN